MTAALFCVFSNSLAFKLLIYASSSQTDHQNFLERIT